MDVVRSLQFMPGASGTLVSASEDCTIKLWDVGQLVNEQSHGA